MKFPNAQSQELQEPEQMAFDRILARMRMRVAIPPIVLVAFAIGMWVSHIFYRWPANLSLALFGIVGLVTSIISYRAGLAPCPHCGHPFFWKNSTWNMFRNRCPHCGICALRVPSIAVVAGYLGLFSLLVIPAPIAVAVSIIALHHLKVRKLSQGRGRAWFGLTMGSLVTLLTVVLFFMLKNRPERLF